MEAMEAGGALPPLPSLQAQGADPNTIYNSALFQGINYRMVGPTRGGRVTAVAGVPSQPNVFYIGAVGGGVWRTDDYGLSWRPVTDGYFETGSIGAIRVADSDPNTIYVGTGSDGKPSHGNHGPSGYWYPRGAT